MPNLISILVVASWSPVAALLQIPAQNMLFVPEAACKTSPILDLVAI